MVATKKLIILKKRMHTINVNVVWGCSYENFSAHKISRSTVVTLSMNISYIIAKITKSRLEKSWGEYKISELRSKFA